MARIWMSDWEIYVRPGVPRGPVKEDPGVKGRRKLFL